MKLNRLKISISNSEYVRPGRDKTLFRLQICRNLLRRSIILIKIPADLTIVTLRDSQRSYPQRFTTQYAQQVFEKASSILEARTNIKFTQRETKTFVEEPPPGTRADAVDDAGFHFLTARFRIDRGVRVIFVDKMAKQEIGGRSREEKRMVLLPYETDLGGTALKLAHEFGHLLGLPLHIDEGPDRVTPEPGNEAQYSQMRNNLMYSNSLSPEALLTLGQVATMRSSQLARQFGGTSIGDMFIPEILKNLR